MLSTSLAALGSVSLPSMLCFRVNPSSRIFSNREPALDSAGRQKNQLYYHSQSLLYLLCYEMELTSSKAIQKP